MKLPDLRNPFAIRVRDKAVPMSAVGGSPLPVPAPAVLRVFRCPDCAFTDRDPSVTFAHLFTHVEDRRVQDRQRGAA